MKKGTRNYVTPSLRILSVLFVFLLLFQYVPLSAADSDTNKKHGGERGKSYSRSEVPENIRQLMDDQSEDKVFLISDPDDEAELFTLRSENSQTGEGTLQVHSVPVKYADSKGDLQFIDTSMKNLSSKEAARRGYAYRNAANRFDVEFGTTAYKGIDFNNAFEIGVHTNRHTDIKSKSSAEVNEVDAGKTVSPATLRAELMIRTTDDINIESQSIVENTETDNEKTESSEEVGAETSPEYIENTESDTGKIESSEAVDTETSGYIETTESGAGKVVYPEVFGPQTAVEYINLSSRNL